MCCPHDLGQFSIWIVLGIVVLAVLWAAFAWFSPRSLLSLCCPEPAAIHRATLLVTASEGTVRQAELTDGGQGEALLEQLSAAEVVPAGRYQNIPIQSVIYRVMLSTVDGEDLIEQGSVTIDPAGPVYGADGRKYHLRAETAEGLLAALSALAENAQPAAEGPEG